MYSRFPAIFVSDFGTIWIKILNHLAKKKTKNIGVAGAKSFGYGLLCLKLGSILSLPFRLWPFNSTSCKLIHWVGLVYATQGAGLHNLGNTCYLNSVLQCLTYTEPFVAYLQSSKHRSSCKFAATRNQPIDIPHVVARHMQRLEESYSYLKRHSSCLHWCCLQMSKVKRPLFLLLIILYFQIKYLLSVIYTSFWGTHMHW